MVETRMELRSKRQEYNDKVRNDDDGIKRQAKKESKAEGTDSRAGENRESVWPDWAIY